ncbi:MAG: nitroreductase family protein [Hyphomicrobiales bacterium]|nr:nitroreductase family protein [Hyphomicrobiales bacterium]
MGEVETISLDFEHRPIAEIAARAAEFRKEMVRRRTVREFSAEPVPRTIIEDCVMTAASAPSGANQQPWTFACISDAEAKRRIRIAAEAEEKAFYDGRAGDEWLEALAPLGTDWEKPFLETAPWLIAVFAQRSGRDAEGRRIKHYYVPESVGISIGLLIASLHHAGLATLTHTPAPMGFLSEICGRPDNEKPLVLVVAGYPAPQCRVPRISKKTIEDVSVWL